MFGERRLLMTAAIGCVILATKRVGEVRAVCDRLTLGGAVDCVLLGSVEGAGRRVSRAERERRPGGRRCGGRRCRSVARRSVGFLTGVIVTMFHASEVCLYDEVDRGRGDNMTG